MKEKNLSTFHTSNRKNVQYLQTFSGVWDKCCVKHAVCWFKTGAVNIESQLMYTKHSWRDRHLIRSSLKYLVKVWQDLISPLSFFYLVFIRFISNFWDGPATLIIQSIFLLKWGFTLVNPTSRNIEFNDVCLYCLTASEGMLFWSIGCPQNMIVFLLCQLYWSRYQLGYILIETVHLRSNVLRLEYNLSPQFLKTKKYCSYSN